MSALIPEITTAGLAAVFSQSNLGFSAEVTHIALGDFGRSPDKSETKLVNERVRLKIADGERINDHQIHVTALADGDTEFWIKEVGFILSDGTMLALWSDTQPLAYKSAQVPLFLAFDLALNALPAESVTVQGTGANLSLAVFTENFIANAISTIKTQKCVIQNAHSLMNINERMMKLENL